MIQTQKKPCRASALPILAVLAIGFALRLYQLGTESLWIDEGYSLRDARASLSLLDARPLYYNMLHWWMRFGESEAWLRMPAVIFGVASILMVYLVGRRLHGHAPAIVASLLVAVSPLHVNHSQEIRMYSLVTFIVTLGVLLFLQFAEKGGLSRLTAVALVGFAAFLVFPLTVLMFGVYTIFLLLHLRVHRRAAVWWLSTQTAMAVLAVPWIPKLLEVTRSYGDAWTWRLAKPGLIDLAWVMRDFQLWRIASSHKTALMVAGIYTVAIIGLAVFGAARGLRTEGRQTTFTLLWLLVPLAATAILSNYAANMWITRYMIYASPALYLLIGLGVSGLARSRALYSVALIGVLILPLARLGVYYRDSEHPEWREAVRYIDSRVHPSDAVALYRSGNQHAFRYYYRSKAPVFPLGEEGLTRESFVGWTEQRVEHLISVIPGSHRKIWFVFSFHEDAGGLAIENYVRKHYKVLKFREWERVRVFETERAEPVRRTRPIYQPRTDTP